MDLAHVRLIKKIVPQCFGKPHWTKLDGLEGPGLWGNSGIFQVLQKISLSHLQLFLMDVPFLMDKYAINCVTKTCGMHNFMKKYYQSITCTTQHGQLDKSHLAQQTMPSVLPSVHDFFVFLFSPALESLVSLFGFWFFLLLKFF